MSSGTVLTERSSAITAVSLSYYSPTPGNKGVSQRLMWLVKQFEEDELESAYTVHRGYLNSRLTSPALQLLHLCRASARLLLEWGAAPLRICCVWDPPGKLPGTSFNRLHVGSCWKWRNLSLHGCCVLLSCSALGCSLEWPGQCQVREEGSSARGWGAAASWAPSLLPSAMHTLSWRVVNFLAGAKGTLVGQAQQSLCCLRCACSVGKQQNGSPELSIPRLHWHCSA